MTKVIITVKGGMVQEVFCRNKDIDIEILDFDTQDPDELKEKETRYKQILNSKSYRDIR